MLRYIKAALGLYDHKWKNEPFYPSTEQRVPHLIGGDFHIGSDYCDNPHLLPMLQTWIERLRYEDIKALRMYLNGDIVDYKLASPDNVRWLEDLNYNLHSLFRDHYEDDGNHGAKNAGLRPGYGTYVLHKGVPFVIIVSPSGRRYAMTHGDLLIDRLRMDTRKKDYWKNYRNRKNGATKWDRMKCKVLDTMDFVKARRPLPEGYIELCSIVASELNVDGLIVNHFHVEAQRWYGYRGKEHGFMPAHMLNTVLL